MGTPNFCCNYGLNGQVTKGADCVSIPGAEPSAPAATLAPTKSVLCGQNMGLANAVVCTRATPFRIRFVSDNFEFAAAATINSEAITANRGFQITYTMDAINCISTNP